MQCYAVAPHQRAFNERVTKSYLKHGSKSPTFIPPSFLGGGCQPTEIGLGPCHVHAPHREVGLPLPPCPYGCGWSSVDRKKSGVRSKGVCAARRVYGEEGDNWVGGQKLKCLRCFEKRQSAKKRLADLREHDEATADKIAEAEAEVKSIKRVFLHHSRLSLPPPCLYPYPYPYPSSPSPLTPSLTPSIKLTKVSHAIGKCTAPTTPRPWRSMLRDTTGVPSHSAPPPLPPSPPPLPHP